MSNTIHDDFSITAHQFPNQVAIWSENETITYKELNKRSSAFAYWLLDKHYAPHQRIAIMLPKSIEAVIAILGSLKAGNAYVPLGTSWPKRRTDSIFANGNLKVLVTQSEINEANTPVEKILSPDTDEWRIATNSDFDLTTAMPKVSQSDLAYILYTSGSTGIPKGVCVSHRAAYCFPAWAKTEFQVTHNERIASIAPFTFDLSTFDLFSGLAAGATIYLVPEKYKLLPSRLSRFFEEHLISIIYAVPSTLSLLALRGRLLERDLSNFRHILFAGEVFPPPLYQKFKELMPANIQYYNLYGPTETNVCTYYKMPDSFQGDTSIPIGKPLPETELITVTDENVIINDTKTPGELCVAGMGVMDGYWGEKNKSGKHWIQVPGKGALKAYKTGDIVEQDNEGNLIYKGRRDSMVKIWGYRVELGEVETCLLTHESVQLSAVIKRPKKDDLGEELVAFVVALDTNDNVKLDLTDLHKHCKLNLPHFMTPKKIYQLPELPINNSGKVDRLQLETLAIEQ